MTTAITAALATAFVLFTRKNNENASSAMDPVGPWAGQADLDAEGTFCVNPDFDMLVSAPLYEVREVTLPAWMTAEEWCRSAIEWRYVWGAGVSKEWPESWQRGLARLPFEHRYAAAKLLAVKSFRSEFRRSLRDQVVAWLETPAADRRYASPLSPKQWDCLNRSPWEARGREDSIYRSRDLGGRVLDKNEARALVATAEAA